MLCDCRVALNELLIDPIEADAVIMIFDLYIDGWFKKNFSKSDWKRLSFTFWCEAHGLRSNRQYYMQLKIYRNCFF